MIMALMPTLEHPDIQLQSQHFFTDEFLWYLTECFCAPRVKGKVVIRKRRPHHAIQVGAISSFLISRNSFASGDLALPLGIWHFACKSHVDVKRVYCRFSSTVSDTTARNALNSMSAADLSELRERVRDATERGEVDHSKIIDNVQENSPVYEHGLGRENQLKVGTACTTVRLLDCKPGAFNATDHIGRVLQQARQTMTTENVYESIDWPHNWSVAELQFTRVFADYTPHLSFLLPEISARFRTPPIAKHRIDPNRETPVQPTGTNGEREVETQGMARALLDFDQQSGIDPDKCDNILSWVRGDGASHATIMRLKKYLAVTPNIYKSFRNVISTPETWHKKATDLNACASNHYGPAASKDPSSLSRSSDAANMKRPTDLKKCDFYPTSRSMTMIWDARVLDCWRLILGIDSDSDILEHFKQLAEIDCLPTLDELLDHAKLLRERYASQAAYDQSLSTEDYDEASSRSKIPADLLDIPDDSAPAETEPLHGDEDAPPPEIPAAPEPKDEGPKFHKETPGFDGDRVLSNAILFLMEFDVGRVMEILKIYIFTFAGTSNQNYMGYMLDLYTLLQFECSPDLKDALLNNWLIKLSKEMGKFIEGDLMQEHYLEDMVRRRGGEFDDKFYRQTIAPNVQHFLQIKEDIESAFDLKRRGKGHTSPHLRDETKVLLLMYKEEELHLFRWGRTMSHAAVNRFDRGYQRLEEGKMAEFLERSAVYAEIVRDMEIIRNGVPESQAIDVDRASPVLSEASYSRDSNNGSTASHPSIHSSSHSHSFGAREWDLVDHSDEKLVSGSDLAVTVDSATGRLNADWYEEEEFESVLERLCGPEEELESSEEEDEPQSSEYEEGSDDEKLE
ncbi:hypothetical protein B0H17DRAFT_1200535 [Mycena rosella]|uniref:DUF6589 domain-containing protein n=1 Tax=Mycena rosella TaxID=1033263 RepID=A0AAD7DIP5_MYCRO|nr:hypothetical protein B0H17DRAFT_1200535 [Mycena rosella]